VPTREIVVALRDVAAHGDVVVALRDVAAYGNTVAALPRRLFRRRARRKHRINISSVPILTCLPTGR